MMRRDKSTIVMARKGSMNLLEEQAMQTLGTSVGSEDSEEASPMLEVLTSVSREQKTSSRNSSEVTIHSPGSWTTMTSLAATSVSHLALPEELIEELRIHSR